MKQYTCACILSVMLVHLISCSKREEKPADLVTFPLKGEVVAIDSARMRVTIHHEEIPDYMMAMTMPFKVKRRELLQQVQVGDTVSGVLAVSRTESWLESLAIVGKGKPIDTTLAEGTILARLFKTGEPLPDDPLTNQEGKIIRFSSFRGKVVAITFIYTRCPLPDFCIRMSDNFAAIQKILAEDKSIDGRWHLLTISFDPVFDTPRVLKGYARGYGANFAMWDFAVAPEPTILKLADGFGLTLADDGGLISHNLRTAIIDGEGRLVKVINGNEWTVEEVVTQIRDLIPD